MNLSENADLTLENLDTKQSTILKQYEHFQFKGSDNIQSHGITSDFNLIYSPELGAILRYAKFNENNNFEFNKKKDAINGIYLLKGKANIQIDQKLSIINEGTLCIINLQNLRAKECKITKNETSPNDCECLYFELFKEQKGINYQDYDFSSEKSRLLIIQELLATEDDLHAMNLFKLLEKTSRSYYFYQMKRHYCHNIVSKVLMLLTGKYQDEIIFQKWVDEKFYPRGSILKGLFKTYKEEEKQLNLIFI